MEYQPMSPDASAELMAGGVVLLVVLVFVLGSTVLGIICWWRIFSKAGYSGAMGLLMLVPIANLIVFLMLAFGTWPIHRELEAARRQT